MNKDSLILVVALFAALLVLVGFIGYMAGQNSNMRYGKCIQQVNEVRYVCTDQTSHGACVAYGLRTVPLCIAWER